MVTIVSTTFLFCLCNKSTTTPFVILGKYTTLSVGQILTLIKYCYAVGSHYEQYLRLNYYIYHHEQVVRKT